MTRSTELCEISRSCHSATFLERRDAVRPHHPRESAHLLAAYRIPFVRHRRTSALLAAKRFLSFANFRALQMPDLQCDLFQRRRDNRERRHILRVPVALDHLRSHRIGPQPQPHADLLLDVRAEVRSVPHRSGKLSHRHAAAARNRSMFRKFSVYQLAIFSPNVIGSA